MSSVRGSLVGMLFLLASSAVVAQEPRPRLDRDAAAVVARSIEWYIESIDDFLRSTSITLVISLRTSAVEIVTTGEAVGMKTGISHTIGFEPADLQQLERQVGFRIATCDTVAGTSLCGIAQPWLWVVVSPPLIEGDRATVVVEARDLEFGPGNREFFWQVAFYDVVLRRERGVWKVVSGTLSGVS